MFDLEINQILKLREKGIKAAIITIVNEVKQIIVSVNENFSREIRYLSREIKAIRNEWNLETEN